MWKKLKDAGSDGFKLYFAPMRAQASSHYEGLNQEPCNKEQVLQCSAELHMQNRPVISVFGQQMAL